ALRLVEEETRPLRQAGTPHEVNFVTHSMGGLVVRHLLTHDPPERVRRFVMLVPPNNGSLKARRFARSPGYRHFYRLVYGRRAGAQLASEPPGVFEACGIPRGVEMGVIAGTGGSRFSIPTHALAGEHDGVLTVEETALPGVPLKKVPYGHTTILFRPQAWREVAHFLDHGRFRAEEGPGEAARADP
ncbi:MAG: esterase/lipase family protein, partial [Candidatus Methylomirabilales bacterium]